MGDDLWGELPPPSEEASPLSIITEQAKLLSAKTSNKLDARVNCLLNDTRTDVVFDLVVKQIGYSNQLLTFHFDTIEYYPVHVSSKVESADPSEFNCANSAEFKAAIATIFRHEEVRTTIGKLLRVVNNGDIADSLIACPTPFAKASA